MTRNQDPRYRFNPLYRNHFKEGQFVSNPNAKLPKAEMGPHFGLYDGSLAGFDWLGEENNTNFTYSEDELDRMVAELNAKGYGDDMTCMGSGDSISYDLPHRRFDFKIRRFHSNSTAQQLKTVEIAL